MMPDTLPDRSEVAKFDQSKLKHVETQQKEVLPTKSGVLIARMCCGRVKRCSVRGICDIHVLSAMRGCQQDALQVIFWVMEFIVEICAQFAEIK